MNMNKNVRKYIALVVAVICYYIVHEGAHLIYALANDAFKGIRLMTLGVQVDIFRDRLSDTQLGWFCLVGPIASIATGWVLFFLGNTICKIKNLVVKACFWYTTVVLLVLDPLYLSIFYRFVGGGDMNGIIFLIPQTTAVVCFAVIGVLNIFFIHNHLRPKYKQSFEL